MSELVDILVVDDERINLKLIEGILKGYDLNLVLALSGREALKLVEKYDFAVALLDVMMPGMDGFELAETLRKNQKTRNLPVIFITAISKEQRNVFHGYELGAVDYLFKPVEPEILRSKVTIFAELHRNKRNLEATTRRLSKTVQALEESQSALQKSEQRYRMVADFNYDWESWIDPEGLPIYISPACERISGYNRDEYMTDPTLFERIIHHDDLPVWRNYMADSSIGEEQGIDFRIHHKNAREKWVSLIKHEIFDDEGNSLGVRTNVRDVTARKRMEDQLKYTSLHDPMTGLANRALFLDRVERAIEQARGRGKSFSVLFINLDRFQTLNDHYGHTFGDIVLMNVGRQLRRKVDSVNTVARFGGDEFVILFEGLQDDTAVDESVHKVQKLFNDSREIEGVEFLLTASMGYDTAINGEAQKDELVNNAQLAMYNAKRRGKNLCVKYEPEMRRGVINVQAIEGQLKQAIENREFEPYYQPIINLADGSIYGFEALARWNHPERGMVSPGEFIPIAEDTGLISDLGAYILEDACSTLNGWRNEYKQAGQMTMAVNISARQFAEASLGSRVEAILDRSGLPPNMLKLEITETVVMLDAMESVNRLNFLKSLGVLLSIDDFGTGYSSMSYLQKFPMDQLKIDLSFVQRMEKSTENVEIVRAIINMAHSLRLRVVAEGIETQRQRDLLYSLQCDYGQGYLYSKPLPKSEMEDFIRNHG